MTRIYRNTEETGRSMVEMLGVLAIVGVLSIGGIAGYSKAMAKYKINKTLDQVSLIITNIRTLYGNQVSYAGLSTATAISYEIVSSDIVTASSALKNPFAGSITIQATKEASNVSASAIPADCGSTEFCPTYKIEYTGLDRAACAAIASADWGGTASSGLIAFKVNSNVHFWGGSGDTQTIPINYTEAYTECSTQNANSITWVYN